MAVCVRVCVMFVVAVCERGCAFVCVGLCACLLVCVWGLFVCLFV